MAAKPIAYRNSLRSLSDESIACEAAALYGEEIDSLQVLILLEEMELTGYCEEQDVVTVRRHGLFILV